jgi:uncharacterized protein (DUF362 family)
MEVLVSKTSENPREKLQWLLETSTPSASVHNICIKANLNDYRRWETASTTDPYLLDMLLDLLESRYPSASITVLENDATGVSADNISTFLGIDKVIKKHTCRFLNVARGDWMSINIDGLHFKQLDVPSILSACDLFITFPKLKSHTITKLTCSLKNQMGLFRPKRKIAYHHILDDLIVDCNLAMKPNLTIVDANLVMEGNYGPTYGSPKKLGLLIASRDLVATDSFCARLFGLKPKSIGYIKKAADKKLGSTRFKLVTNFDFDYGEYKLKFSLPLYYMIRRVASGLKK